MTTPPLHARSAIERERLLGLSTDIAICVHDGLNHVQSCLQSVVEHLNRCDRLIVVDDGSGQETAAYLVTFMQELAGEHVHIRHEHAGGYTAAANAALRCSRADYVILLNSDTVVTEDWAVKLKEVGESAPDIGVIGPMSNAASWQSIPRLLDERGDHAVNDLPPGWTLRSLDWWLELTRGAAFPRVPLINGFCFAIKRAVIDEIGPFDEQTFPNYGEENDYCFRMTDAGFMGAIATHAYVYHAKSKSYSHERRRPLIKRNSQMWHRLYGKRRVINAFETMRQQPALARIRRRAHGLSPGPARPAGNAHAAYSVLYLCAGEGGAAGAGCAMQDALGLDRLGVLARVAVPQRLLPICRREVEPGAAGGLLLGYSNEVDLVMQASRFDVVVATGAACAAALASVCSINEDALPAFHIRDGEADRWTAAAGAGDGAGRATPIPSLAGIRNAVLFAKSWRLCRAVESVHGVKVFKVAPGVDTSVFRPHAVQRRAAPIRVAARMAGHGDRQAPCVSPSVLLRLRDEFGEEVQLHVFGDSPDALRAAGLPEGIRIDRRGVLGPGALAGVLRDTDVFVDLSPDRGSAETGLAAMACAAAAVLPAIEDVEEYARHEWNALLRSAGCEQSYLEALRRLVKDAALCTRLGGRGVSTARRFTVPEAVRSQHVLLRTALRAHRASRAGRMLRLATLGSRGADRSDRSLIDSA